VDDLDRFLDDARVAESARARQQERWLRQVDEEDASLVGALIDLAERGTAVVVDATTGVHRGRLRLVASDFCILTNGREEVWITYRAIAIVRPEASEWRTPASGSRVAGALRLVDALGTLVGERPKLTFVLEGARRVSGVLVGVGRDVVSVRLVGDAAAMAYVPVASVRVESNVNQIG